MKATAKDLRFYSKELLESANRGEEVVITYRGKPYAKLIPFDRTENSSEDQKHSLFGIWKDNEDVADVDNYIRHIRKGRF